jgi:SAM-dependent methyltransferase
MQECDKIRDTVMPYFKDRSVLDLGCGEKKVVPWAVGVDDGSEWGVGAFRKKGPDLLWSVAPGNNLKKALGAGLPRYPVEYDTVFSSHTLEHMKTPILDTLRHWLTFVKPGGTLVLYLPDERDYIYDRNNPKVRNPAHYHYLTAEIFHWYLQQLAVIRKYQLETRTGPNEYSFLVIAHA